MPRIPIFKLGSAKDEIVPPRLASYTPTLTLEGLQLGVDNLRHDVHLSPRFVEQTRRHIARLTMRHGNVDGLLEAEVPDAPTGNHFIGSGAKARTQAKTDFAELKPLLTDIHTAALNA